jgi:hypothetical protein
MKAREVTNIWPPHGAGEVPAPAPGEGVLKDVRRSGNRLDVTIEHEGREALAFVKVAEGQAPSLDAVKTVLSANLGKTVSELGDLEV